MKTYDIKIISKLNRETKEGTIKWDVNRTKPSSLSGSEQGLDNVYTAIVLGKKIRLYKYQYRSYYDEGLYDWVDSYRLEFIDDWGNSLWTFPDDRAIYDLYETVRYKTSNIEDFFNDYLSDEEKNEREPDSLF